MTNTADYTVSVVNWRKQLRINEARTRWVIIIFFAIYIAIGLLADLYINADLVSASSEIAPYHSIHQLLHSLVTFGVIPYATLVTILIALISLLVTFSYYDKLMLLGTLNKQITFDTAKTPEDKQLYNVVEEMKVAAGLRYMPKIFIIEANYMNAFASGYNQKTAMIAITRGLLRKLERSELQAVMAHELSHIRHHDIKLTLMASILSNLILIAIDLLFRDAIYNRDRKTDPRLFIVIMVLRAVLPITTVLLMLYLSRTREYMADAGCVELMRDNTPLGKALLKIHQDHQDNRDAYGHIYRATAHENIRRESYLYDPIQAGVEPVHSLSNLFSTHPDMKHRLAALGFRYNPLGTNTADVQPNPVVEPDKLAPSIKSPLSPPS